MTPEAPGDLTPLTDHPFDGLIAVWNYVDYGLAVLDVVNSKQVDWFPADSLLMFLERYSTEEAFNLIFRQSVWRTIPELAELGRIYPVELPAK